MQPLNEDVGLLDIIAIVVAVVGGSGLFVTMEGYFDLIYHIYTRVLI